MRWDGTNGGTMFQCNAWYSRISRLTFDGAGRAGTGLQYGPAFSTYNETIKNEPMIEPDESTEPDSIAATIRDAGGADNQSKPPYR